MDTSVDLQKMMTYADWPIYTAASIFGVVSLLLLIFLILKIIRIVKAHRKPTIKEIMRPKPNVPNLKKEYLAKLYKVEGMFDMGEYSIRQTYEAISKIIRDFAFKVTGVEVHKYTLEDIKKTGMTSLATLVEEYYKPEFEQVSEGDVKASINKTKKAIEEWN